MILLLVAGAIVLQIWVWRRLADRMRRGKLARLRAFAGFLAWALFPALFAVVAFLAAVGLEEWLGVALIGETVARAALPLVVVLLGIAALGSLCFGVRCAWLGRRSIP